LIWAAPTGRHGANCAIASTNAGTHGRCASGSAATQTPTQRNWNYKPASQLCRPSKKHFEVAAAANVALIVQVKDNQPTLHQRVQEISAITTAIGSAHSHDKGRNCDERRTVTVFDPTDKLADTDWHPYVAATIRVERHVYTRNAKTGLLRRSAETAFYISNTPVTAARAAEAIRAHWKIENTSHYTRDVTLGEDRSRIRHQSRRVRPTAQLRLQHSQGKPNRHAQPGPLPRPVSQASNSYSECSLFHSVEQPCLHHSPDGQASLHRVSSTHQDGVIPLHHLADKVDDRTDSRHRLEILVDDEPPVTNEVDVG